MDVMSATQEAFGPADANSRPSPFSATGRSWFESVVHRNRRAVFAGSPHQPGEQAMQFLLGGGPVAVPREGLLGFRFEGLLPLPEQAVGDAQLAGGFGEAEPLVGDQPDGLDLELTGERPAGSHHRPPHQ